METTTPGHGVNRRRLYLVPTGERDSGSGIKAVPTVLTDYTVWCRAAGMRPLTIRLRMQWLRRAASEIDLETATTRDLLAWLAQHDSWQPETRRSARGALRSFYQWAVDDGRLTSDPSAKLPAVRVPTGVPKPVPTEVLRQALAQASDRDTLMIGLAAFAGLRRSEIAGLPWAAIVWPGLRVVGKGGRTRTMPLLPQLADLLNDERRKRDGGCWGCGWRYAVDPASPYVLPSHTGEHLSADVVGRVLSRALGPGWTGHKLRHRFATLAYAVDRDLLTVQQLLGHSSPQTTAIYIETSPDAAAAAVAGVAA